MLFNFDTCLQELKCIQIETGQTIASLRSALREKDNELRQIHDSSTASTSNSINATASSALNVADYECDQNVSRDVSGDQETDDNEKVYYLSQKLVQRQGKIDSLLAENNCMKIQLKNLEVSIKIIYLSLLSYLNWSIYQVYCESIRQA